MGDLDGHQNHSPANMLAGASAHLAQHMENGCPRSSYLAVMLLEQITLDPSADPHLRQHACQLVEILERDADRTPAKDARRGLPAQPALQLHTGGFQAFARKEL